MDMSREQSSGVIKEGFLVKRGHIVTNWKTRWFVLQPDKLLYYKYESGKKEARPRGKIPLTGCKVTCPCLEYENRPMVIKLQTPSSVEYFLEASSREDRDMWASHIIDAIHTLSPGESCNMGSDNAPLDLNNVNLSQVIDSMRDIRTGIRLANHSEQGNSFKKCFTGSALIDWLVSKNLVLTRFEAMTLASTLLDESLVKPLGVKSSEAIRNGDLAEQFLDDSTALYTFSEVYKRRGSVKNEIALSAVELSGKVVKQGYLLKQGHKRKNWKVRLFVLRAEPDYLHYYDPSKEENRPAGGFPIRGCLVSALEDNGVPTGVKGNVQGNLFKIITQNDVHYFIQATSKEDRQEWIAAIKQLA
ncbi:pleckstrin-2 isoform X1 [Polypterus senegalus]|uniref:pleckstrin-2 isoform X1 n=1 Tax=Polypterus senegalus TaxID=55291 RepID=UPI001964ADDC|nr:pleckstrin-2 isoform X1 [Polypterus senegalus]